jgi:hypothetical protein
MKGGASEDAPTALATDDEEASGATERSVDRLLLRTGVFVLGGLPGRARFALEDGGVGSVVGAERGARARGDLRVGCDGHLLAVRCRSSPVTAQRERPSPD